MKEQYCRDCGKPLGIPIVINKLTGKPRKSKRCTECHRADQNKYHRRYRTETIEERLERKKAKKKVIQIKKTNKYMEMPIENPKACARAKAIRDAIFNGTKKPGFTRADVFGTPTDRDAFMEQPMPKVMV